MELAREGNSNFEKNLIKKKSIIKQQGLLLGFIILVLVISFISPEFATLNNFLLVLRQVSIIGVAACAITFVMIGGNFDLSIGSTISLTTVLSITLHDQLGAGIAIFITLFIGLIIGCINGVIVGILKLNSLITTLGMLSVISGLTLLYTGGSNVSIADPESTWFSYIGRGFIFGIPVPVIIFIISAIIFGIILRKTLYGRYLFAVGGNSIASQFSGIKASYVVFITYVLSGLMASIAGIMMASRLMSAQNYQGQGLELSVLAAVILGGASLLGGSGSIYKTVIGVLILGFLQNGMVMLGFPYYTQWIATWIIIIVAVWFDIISKKRR